MADDAPPIDLYRDPHKGLRAELFATTELAGSLDPADESARRALDERVQRLVRMCASHAEHEDTCLLPAIESAVPDHAERIVVEHRTIHVGIGRIGEMAGAAAAASPARARDAVHRTYLALGAFTGIFLGHLDLEEREVMPALADALGAGGVLELSNRMTAHIPRQDMAEALALMLPAMNVDDRTELLGAMHADAPAEVFDQTWSLANDVLTEEQIAAVRARLGLAG